MSQLSPERVNELKNLLTSLRSEGNLSAFISKFTKKNQDDLMNFMRYLDSEYDKGRPVIDDATYDRLRSLVSKKFPTHPYFDLVGAPAGSGNPKSKKVKLPTYMGSLNKIVKEDRAVSTNLAKFLNKFDHGDFLISDKLDGVSALIDKTRTGIKMYTRGDGYEGQDISWAIPLIDGIGIPPTKETYMIRGELVIAKPDFESLQDVRANSRNMVAGLINSKHPDKSLMKLITFVPYTMISPRLIPSSQIRWLDENGYEPVHSKGVCVDDINIKQLSTILETRRQESIYDIDGIVITYDIYQEIEEGSNPSHAIAFKQLDDTADVIVDKVVWESSKNGLMKPVVHFPPTSLSGATIQKATGFNAKYIKENNIGPGAVLKISRSGEVIPHIVQVLQPAKSPSLPEVEYTWTPTGVDIIIADHENNEGVIIKNIITFFTTLKVPGFSTGNVSKMYNSGFKTLRSILKAREADFQKVLGNKNGSTIYEAVQNLKDSEHDCSVLMYATNSFGQGFGSRKLELILESIPEILENASYVPTTEELINIDGISHTTSSKFMEGLAKFRQFQIDNSQIRCRKKCKKEENNDSDGSNENKNEAMQVDDNVSPASSILEGSNILFTGFRDAELQKRIERLGGIVVPNLTKKVNILIHRNVSSTKVKRAMEMENIEIVSETDFRSRIGM